MSQRIPLRRRRSYPTTLRTVTCRCRRPPCIPAAAPHVFQIHAAPSPTHALRRLREARPLRAPTPALDRRRPAHTLDKTALPPHNDDVVPCIPSAKEATDRDDRHRHPPPGRSDAPRPRILNDWSDLHPRFALSVRCRHATTPTAVLPSHREDRLSLPAVQANQLLTYKTKDNI